MKLIDADKLVTILDEELQKDDSLPKALLVGFAKQILNDAPTVEAEPVRYGRWIDDKIAFYRQCSECGANVRANLYEVFLDCDIRDLHYCPNCGAKMEDIYEEI